MAAVINANFEWQHGNADLLSACGLEPGGRVQMAIDAAVIRFSIPYCPFETGTLANSPLRASAIGSGKVVYAGPYAHYLYYGIVYGPNHHFTDKNGEEHWWSPPVKFPTNRKLKYKTDVNPLAGSFWFERMKADHAEHILQEAINVARG
jgi:hypothetical protein